MELIQLNFSNLKNPIQKILPIFNPLPPILQPTHLENQKRKTRRKRELRIKDMRRSLGEFTDSFLR